MRSGLPISVNWTFLLGVTTDIVRKSLSIWTKVLLDYSDSVFVMYRYGQTIVQRGILMTLAAYRQYSLTRQEFGNLNFCYLTSKMQTHVVHVSAYTQTSIHHRVDTEYAFPKVREHRVTPISLSHKTGWWYKITLAHSYHPLVVYSPAKHLSMPYFRQNWLLFRLLSQFE